MTNWPLQRLCRYMVKNEAGIVRVAKLVRDLGAKEGVHSPLPGV